MQSYLPGPEAAPCELKLLLLMSLDGVGFAIAGLCIRIEGCAAWYRPSDLYSDHLGKAQSVCTELPTWPVSAAAGALLALSFTISTPSISPWPRTSPMMLCFSCSALILSSNRLPTCKSERPIRCAAQRQP